MKKAPLFSEAFNFNNSYEHLNNSRDLAPNYGCSLSLFQTHKVLPHQICNLLYHDQIYQKLCKSSMKTYASRIDRQKTSIGHRFSHCKHSSSLRHLSVHRSRARREAFLHISLGTELLLHSHKYKEFLFDHKKNRRS